MPDCCFNLPQFDIKKYRYWTVGLNPDQHFLGRTIIMLNRHEEDMWNITPEEREELWEIGGKLEQAITNMFHPDHFNYTRLGHQIKHLNLHVIPRYQDPRTFMGEEFMDERWGQTPTAAERSLPEEIVRSMIEGLKEELEKE